MIITIGGEYGCGSKESARLAAEAMGYTIYDDEIIRKALELDEDYIDEETLRFYDESEGKGSVNDIAQLSKVQSGVRKIMTSLSLDVLPLDLRLDTAIQKSLNSLADNDNCIILGRCANYYLRDRENIITVFFADKPENKVKRIMRVLECDAATAEKFIEKTDKRRSEFYTYFTGEKWDDAGKNFYPNINWSCISR